MLELTADNALEYLQARGWVGAGPNRVELLAGGVSNVVLCVETPERKFVLKQSRPQLRTRDAWFSDIERVYREQEVMEVLGPLLPPLGVPAVLFSDRDNYVFAMSHAPAEARNWKEMLLAGEANPAQAGCAGTLLGRMHQATAGNPDLERRFGDGKVFTQLRIDPYYRRIQERLPDTARAIEPIIDRLLHARSALCHGDSSPKNMLVHDRGIMLLDYEAAYFGDPTMDLGFLLSHLLLKAVKFHPRQHAYLELTRAFWKQYAAEVRFRPLAILCQEGIEHLAVCLLARIDGTSPVEYLPDEPRRELVRRLGRRLLRERPAAWEEVLQITGKEMSILDEK